MTTLTSAQVGHGRKGPTAVEIDGFRGRLIRAGHHILYSPDHALIHYGGRSTSAVHEEMSVEFYRSQAFFYRKNYGLGKYLLLKLVVAAGLAFWTMRSTRAVLRGRIDGALYRTRLRNYARILLM